MDKAYIKNVVVDQRELFSDLLKSQDIIPRTGAELCRKHLSKPNILLISGLRRSGKSVFSHLLTKGANVPFINFDDERLIGAGTSDLNAILESFYELYGEFDHILLDEIQNIKGWELFVNRLRNKYKVIITGSNSNLLSSEMATHLTGRFLRYELFPLSFSEFLRFKGFIVDENSVHSTKARSKIHNLFSSYLKDGGIFEFYKFGREFLRGLFSSIIMKDIIGRYDIKYPIVLEELALLLINQFSSKVSVNKMTKYFKVKSPHTIKEYIRYLENTFLIFTINKFSCKVKEQLSTFKKVYVVDNGMINSFVFGFSENRGPLLENLVAVELKRMAERSGLHLYYWDNYNVECDFLIKRGTRITEAFQVCHGLNLNNRKREMDGLIGALREFGLKNGCILTDSQEEDINVDGFKINVMPVWKWLLENRHA